MRSWRIGLLLAAAALAGFLVATAAAAPSCTDTYTNAVTTGDWSTAANWSTGKVPTSSDVACWASNQTLTVSASGDSADSVQGGGLTISSGDLFLASSTNDSSVTTLTINGGAMNGNGRTLSVAGDFDWNVPNGTSSALGGASALNFAQTGSHSFKIEGAGTESMSRGSFSTPNPVSISNTNFSPGNFPGPTLTTTSTVTFGAGSYSGAFFTMTAAGIVTPTGAVATQYSLDLTGNSSDVKGDLTLAGLSSDSGTTLSIPSGHSLTAGAGTISGTVDGLGSYVHDGSAQHVASGGVLSPAGVSVTSGALTLDQGGTYAPSGTTTIGGAPGSGSTLELDDSGSTGGLTLTEGSLSGTSGSVLTVAGDFDWNTPSGATSGINTSPHGLTVSQSGTHSFNIAGSGTAAMDGGSLTTSNPVTITNTSFSPGNFPGPALTTTSTVTFGAGTYPGGNFTMTAAGIVTGGDVSSQYSLDLTGSSSVLGGNLTLAGLSVEAGKTLTIPSGDMVSAGGGTIAGAVNGAGTFDQSGGPTTVVSGGSLAPGAVTSRAGQLTIDSGASYSPGSTTVTLTSGANPGRLEIDDSGASTGALTITGGSFNGPRLNGSGKLTVAGDFDWNIPSGGISSINDTSPNSLVIAQTGTQTFKIEGSGTASIGGGLLTTPNDVSITDPNLSPAGFPGGALTTTGVVSFAPGSYGGGNFAITAAGVKTAGGAVHTAYSLDLTGSSSSLGGDLGLGALSVEAGQTLTIPSGDTVSAGGGTISGTINGEGTFDQHGAATTLASGGTLSSGAFTATAGQLTVSPGATFSTGSTALSAPDPATPSRLEIDDSGASTGPLTITGNSFNGPRLTGSGKLTVAGNFDWNSPSGGPTEINDTSPNSLTVAQTGAHTFKIEGSGSAFLGGGTLTTPNPVTISNPNFVPEGFGSSLTTTSTVTFTNAGSYPGGNLALTAAGINLAAGDTTLPYTLDLTGASTSIPTANSLTADQVNASGGTLQVDGALASPLSLSGGTLKGTGTVSGPVENSGGTVAPGDSPGTLTITGDYTQDAGGTLAEDITGTTPGAQFDQLVVTGALTLDGTLALDWHTFTPADTDTFKIIAGATSRTGNFATVTGATIGGNTFQAHGDADGVTVEVQPPPAPANTSLPLISGSTTQGQTLHTTNGNWDNNPTSFDYQWEDCDSAGNNCTNVGTDSSAYTLTGNDAGDTIRVVVSAHNLGGSGQATSDPTAVVKPLPPSNTAAPTISGTPNLGQTVTCQNGSWSNNPTGFAYQWNRDGTPISGATAQTYSVQSADQGHALTCAVTASNAGGNSSPKASPAVNVAAPPPPKPSNTSAPTISGTPNVGQTLTCQNGSWSNNPTGFAYQWSRDGVSIPGAANQTYSVQPDDQGHALTCAVTASNAGGPSSPATSSALNVPAKPVNITPPTITGTPLPGNTLTCHPGTWSGNPSSFDYQWDRNASQIPGATQQQYQVQIADEGSSLGCGVNASNGSATSSATASAPVIVAVKGTLTCPKPTGQISGVSLGPLALGMKQTRARAVLKRFAVTRNHFDDFCLFGGWGIRAAYPSSRLLSSLRRGQRSRLIGKIVIALTANPFYALDGVRPGASLSEAQSKLHLSKVFHIGLNDWYIASRPLANGVLKVRRGIVQEVGLVNRLLTRTRKAQGRLLVSFK